MVGVSNETVADGRDLALGWLFVDQYVLPGQIIVRQRGTQFHAGQNVSETFLLVVWYDRLCVALTLKTISRLPFPGLALLQSCQLDLSCSARFLSWTINKLSTLKTPSRMDGLHVAVHDIVVDLNLNHNLVSLACSPGWNRQRSHPLRPPTGLHQILLFLPPLPAPINLAYHLYPLINRPSRLTRLFPVRPDRRGVQTILNKTPEGEETVHRGGECTGREVA